MNDTILKYIKTLGTYSWNELSFNEVDALIFSLVSYIDFTGIIKEEKTLTFKDTENKLQSKFKLKSKDKFLNNIKEMFTLMAKAPRYSNLILENYVKINTKNEQFAAIMIRIDTKNVFISYEGTEDNLVGWEEDLRISHMFPIPAQQSAIDYLNKYHKTYRHIYIGGHSKGGNLSMAAPIKANFWVRHKIKQIYNFDGPGFLNDQINSRKFKKYRKKIITYIPEESLIGVLLENSTQTKVIKSYAKKTLQHDAFTWKCFGPLFILGTMSDYSYNIKRKVKQILGNNTKEDRKLFVDTLFKVLYNSGYTEKSELNKINLIKVKNIIKETHKLTKEEKRIVLDVFKIFLQKENSSEKENSHN